MAKQSKNKKLSPKKKNKQISNKIRHLEVLLKYTMRAADGKHEEIDRLFLNQASRIQQEIDKLKENQ